MAGALSALASLYPVPDDLNSADPRISNSMNQRCRCKQKGKRSVRMLCRVMAYKSARDCATLMRRHLRLMRACLMGSRSNINATWPASKKTIKQLINRNFVVSKNRDYY
jgi:hypothetical protein